MGFVVGFNRQCRVGGHPIGAHKHDDDGFLWNFEQFGCPERNWGAHSIIIVYTRSWRDFFQKRHWIKCFHCNGKWSVVV